MTVRIYSYGLPFGPVENEALVDQQMWLAHRYHNDLVAIERSRRDAVQAVMSESGIGNLAEIEARIAVLDAELAELCRKVKKVHAKERRRSGAGPEKARIVELKAALKADRALRKSVKAALWSDPVIKEKFDAIYDRAAHMRRLYRAECGVYWGTYLLVEQAIKAASKSVTPPSFKHWGNGRGRVGVQLQGGMTVAQALSCTDTRLRITPVPPETWTGTRGQRRRLSRTQARLRVGSDGRDPVWATFPMILSRPLPEDGVIKWAWAIRRKVGTRYRWELQLTIESKTFVKLPKIRGSVAAIDIGWRHRGEDGLRVGYLCDIDGHQEEIVVPRIIIDRLNHANSLRSIRDRSFNEIRATLYAWMQDNEQLLPEWFRDDLKFMMRWKRSAKLTSTVWHWRDHRFDGDEGIFTACDAWRRQERHLYQWESHERTKALGRRREHYRVLARQLAEKYATIVIEDIDMSRLARRAKPEQKEELHEAARLQRTQVAVSELRSALALAASNTGMQIVKYPPPYTTLTCNECGGLCQWDLAAELRHQCEHCGAEWDQDENAAKNLLRMHFDDAQAAE